MRNAASSVQRVRTVVEFRTWTSAEHSFAAPARVCTRESSITSSASRSTTRLAVEQWQHYVAVLQRYEWQTIEVPRADDCPDGVFIEDTMVVYRSVALISRPGRAEPQTRDRGCRAHRGGGSATPSNAFGEPGNARRRRRPQGRQRDVRGPQQSHRRGRRRAVTPDLRATGVSVVEVPVAQGAAAQERGHGIAERSRHRISTPDSTTRQYFQTFIPVPEPASAHVVLLGDDRFSMAASAPASAALFAGLGYEPIVVDISEYEKLEGCVTCLSVRLRGERRMTRTLLLLHGLGATAAAWNGVRREIEQRSLGESARAGPQRAWRIGMASVSTPLAAYAAEVAALVHGKDDAFVIGHSLGAYIGLALASGWFGVEVAGVLGIGPKITWTEADLQGVRELAARPPR